MDFEIFDAEQCGIGESPVWDKRENKLYWVDIVAGAVFCRQPDTGSRAKWQFGEPVSALGLALDGTLVIALTDTIIRFDPVSDSRETIVQVQHAKPGMRFNDGKVGPDGAFWVGSMDPDPQGSPAAALYRVTSSGECGVEVSGLRTSNGLAWTADGRRMFHSDSRGPWIDLLDFDPATGAATNRRRLVDLDDEKGRPDGGACDLAGNYWSAGISAGCLNCFDQTGALIDRIDVPSPRPTMPCFGGPDDRTLFLTGLSVGFTDEQRSANPAAGATLAAKAPIAGVPAFLFR